ncbi:hypothetical protein HUW62_05240 [Myxococcus sp. AM011]|nr:hypothetical protein [Myxococcus sp. AM011]
MRGKWEGTWLPSSLLCSRKRLRIESLESRAQRWT